MPGWPSWLGRETHRVNTIIARFLRHLEVAGSNPAPGTFFNKIFDLIDLAEIFIIGAISNPITTIEGRMNDVS